MGILNDLYVRIKGDSSGLDGTLDKTGTKVQGWSSKIAGLLKGAFAVGAVATFAKAVIGASEDLSDKFTKAVEGAKGALQRFYIMMSTGDFSNFFANLAEGYEKASKLAEAMDLFADKRAYMEYVISGKKTTSAQYEEIVKDKSGKYALETRQEYAAKLKEIELEIKDMTQQINQETFNLEAQGWENRNRMGVEAAKKLYEDVQKISEEKQKAAKERFDEIVKNFGKQYFMGMENISVIGVFDHEVKILREYYNLLLQGEKDIIPKLYETYKKFEEGTTAAQERFNGVLRITNELLRTQTETIRGGIVSPVSGTGNLPSFAVQTPGLAAVKPAVIPEMTEAQKQWVQGWQQAADMAVSFMEDAFIGLFERIGSGNFEGFGKELLAGFGRLIADLGKMLVTFGTTMLLSLTLAKVPTIPTAIAAIAVGASAMAIGGLMIGAASRGGQSLTTYSGSSGGVKNNLSTQQIKVLVEGKISGRDIAITNRRYLTESSRNT